MNGPEAVGSFTAILDAGVVLITVLLTLDAAYFLMDVPLRFGVVALYQRGCAVPSEVLPAIAEAVR